ncbi:hypothetical protein DEU56DRAFT_721617, partial [Suillus clintonianus]|uniref:uncharacterized protein n=1 Tax=Suillus clintonianus TaxID=1904413 RepID=UPI001B874772
VDEFIISTRRKSGQQTEKSVLNIWKRWLTIAIASGQVPDVIIDAHHIIKYLKYTGTRKLLTRNGGEQDHANGSLREDFDVTENTILDSHLFPEHFEQVKKSVFTSLTQLLSVIKAHQCWTWQCTTLNWGDELVTLLLSCIQPYKVFVPDYTTADGRRSGKPDYNFVLPHKDPLKCPIRALAISLHYQFDQEGLMSKVNGWDWSRSATWREVKLMFGKHVGQPSSGDALRKMYTTMLGPTTITSKKKLHLARCTMPSVMEDMGSVIFGMFFESLAVCALAGFYVGEQYNVPWATTDVPAELQMQIFPFAEDALANLRQAPNINYGTVNFLELLQLLRGYFWQVVAAIHHPFPDSALLKWLHVVQSSEAKMFLRQWPRAREALEATAQSDLSISSSFAEAATQSAFLLRRTEPLSPSKN